MTENNQESESIGFEYLTYLLKIGNLNVE